MSVEFNEKIKLTLPRSHPNNSIPCLDNEGIVLGQSSAARQGRAGWQGTRPCVGPRLILEGQCTTDVPVATSVALVTLETQGLNTDCCTKD